MPENIETLAIKFLKFGLVGFSGLIIDFGTTYLAKEKLRWNKYIANSLGFTLASVNNFILNRIWTFESLDPEVGWQFSKFMLVAVIGLLLNNLIVYLLTDRVKFNFYLSKLFAIVTVFLWNFLLNYLYTFRG